LHTRFSRDWSSDVCSSDLHRYSATDGTQANGDGKNMTYLTIKTLHLLAAIAFIGTLFFQVLILAPASRRLAPAVREAIGPVLGRQARHVIHFVALVLSGAGLTLVCPCRTLLATWPRQYGR